MDVESASGSRLVVASAVSVECAQRIRKKDF